MTLKTSNWRIRKSSLCELGRPVVGCQGREKKYFSFKVICFIPENEISNSVKVFLGYILFHYSFFFPKINGSAGSGGSGGSTGSTGSGGSAV